MLKRTVSDVDNLMQHDLIKTVMTHNQDTIFITDINGIIKDTYSATQPSTEAFGPVLKNKPIHTILIEQPDEMKEAIVQKKIWTGCINTQDRHGARLNQLVTIIPLVNEHNDTYAIVYLLKNNNDEAWSHATLLTHDQLTGLYNRQHLIKLLHQRTKPCAISCIDLDNFRRLNDFHSYPFGDAFLISASLRLKQLCQPQDLLFHTGRGEFYVVKPGRFTQQQLKQEAERLIKAFQTPFSVNNQLINITTSIGTFNIPTIDMPTEPIMSAVDIALYQAKLNGKNGYVIYTPALEARMREQHTQEVELRHAIENNEMSVHYQPQYCLKTNEMIGVEALARWQKNNTTIMPNDFIPAAESSLAIIPIGEFILNRACKEIHQINQQRKNPLRLAVNVSSAQLMYSDFISTVKTALKQTHFDPSLLDLEITESIIMSDLDHILPQLHQLDKLGIQITIDDFGTGYSSLSYLRSFPLKKIKVDKSFLDDPLTHQSNYPILKAIVELASKIGLSTVAEGIESQQQLAQIQALACDGMQGFFFAKPMPYMELIKLTSKKITD